MHEGEQLELALFEELPWRGVSPRVLTKYFKPLFSRQEPPGSMRFFLDPEQYDFWLTNGSTLRKGSRRSSPGAPLLVELPPQGLEDRYGSFTKKRFR